MSDTRLANVKFFDEKSYPFNIVFCDSDNKEIGKLIENKNGELSAEGNMDEMADILFEKIIKKNSKYISHLENKLKQAV